MAQPYSVKELQDQLDDEFTTFVVGNPPLTAMDGTNVYLCGVTQTEDWAPIVVLNEAKNWWLNVKHGGLMQSNENYRRNAGPAWSPPRYARVRGPAVKLYSQGRDVMNFEYIDTTANRQFNFHVPAFPRALAVAGLPMPIPPSLHGWKLQGGAWVRRQPPQVLPAVWGKPATVIKDPRGF